MNRIHSPLSATLAPRTRLATGLCSLSLALALACGGGDEPGESHGAAPEAPVAGAAAGDQPRVRGAAEVLREDPCVVEARAMISEALHSAKKYQEQLKLLEGGTKSCPDKLEYQNDFAYVLATVPDDSLRDGKRALEIAKQIVAAQPEDPAYLDTLAAAYAEVGEFDAALKSADAALAALEKQQARAEVVAVFKGHRDAFAAKQPIRE